MISAELPLDNKDRPKIPERLHFILATILVDPGWPGADAL
jgi:hypothetical protein